jgi:hypothetical protein
MSKAGKKGTGSVRGTCREVGQRRQLRGEYHLLAGRDEGGVVYLVGKPPLVSEGSACFGGVAFQGDEVGALPNALRQ